MKKLMTICTVVTMILVLSGAAQAEIKTYYIVDYPACQIDTATRSTIHVSGTIMADPTTGVIDSASFTISSGTQSYTASNVEVNPYINSNSIYAFSVTPTQIVLNETYGCIYLKGVNGGYTESLQWYIPPDPWTPTFYPYRGYMGFEGAGHGYGLGFGGDIGTVYPWVVATVVPPTTTTVTALPVANSVGSADYAAEFAPGSWQANATVAGQKAEYYISPQALFGRDVNIGEILSISYFTKKNTTHTVNAADWYINIYTKPDTNLPVHGTWYGNRIGSEPYFSQNLVDPCNTWNQWVTAAGQNNRLRFFDSTNNQYFGSYTDGFLSDLTGSASYNNQKILSFSVQTGSAWANGFTGLVDGLSIELAGGDVGRVNFVATSFCPDPLVGDLDGDCMVNFIDFAIMAENWLKSNLVSQEAGLDNLQWSVRYMIDTSQTDFGQIQNPAPRDNRGLAISPDGRYLYAGYNNGPAVRRIDLTVSDYIDAADTQITGVRGKSIDVDDAGRVYLAEGASIKVYNADLSSNLFNLTGLTNSEGVAVTRKNGQLVLYNSDRNDGTLKKWLLAESGGSITSATLDTTFGSGGSVALAGNLRGVGVDSNGKIWVAGYGNNTVYRISSDGLTVNSLTVNSPIDIDFIAGTVLVSRYTNRVISRFDMNTMLSAGADITVPWTALELDPDGQSAGGALSGIVVFGDGFFVANETGQTADEKSTYGRTDGNSGYIGDKFYTDLYNDDNDPILFTVPAQATITCSGPLAGDMDGDCTVNLVDLAKMAENWLICGLQPQSSCP